MPTNADMADFDDTMTLGELISEFSVFSPDSKVVFLDNYGDRVSTIQCLYVRKVEERDLSEFKKTAYSDTGVALKNPDRAHDEDEDEDEDDDPACNGVSIVTIAPYNY